MNTFLTFLLTINIIALQFSAIASLPQNFSRLVHYREPQSDLEMLYFPKYVTPFPNIGTANASDIYLREFYENITLSRIGLKFGSYPYYGWDNITYNNNTKTYIYTNIGEDPTFNFDFDYIYSCFRTGSGKGVFSAYLTEFKLYVSYQNFPNIQVSVDFKFSQMNIEIQTGPYVGDREVERLTYVAISNWNKNPLRALMKAELEKAYFNLYTKNYNFELRTNIFNNTNVIDAVFTRPPEPRFISQDEGPVYYSKGVINKNYSDPNNQIEWDNFTLSDGEFQFFFHQSLLNDLLYTIAGNKLLQFNVNNTNLHKNCSFTLNIDYLSRVLPGKF